MLHLFEELMILTMLRKVTEVRFLVMERARSLRCSESDIRQTQNHTGYMLWSVDEDVGQDEDDEDDY